MPSPLTDLQCIEELIRRDPARRGLLGDDASTGLGLGQLPASAEQLAAHAREVAIVTGFPIPMETGAIAETDGPLGAVILAATLRELGVETCLVTDEPCAGAVGAAAEFVSLPPECLATCPLSQKDAQGWCIEFLKQRPRLSHLIAVERPGPGHTLESIAARQHTSAETTARFARLVPPPLRGRCCNMRGEAIDAWTAPLYALFECLPQNGPHVRTIGVSDGGNEIGMGRFPWEQLAPLVPGGQGASIVCRTATDWTILAGTSNWGAYALAAAVALLRGRPDVLAAWTPEHQSRMLRHIVECGPAVDGVTRQRDSTVDGLPFADFIQPWAEIRAMLGLDERGGAGE
jgi:hypothetical protein